RDARAEFLRVTGSLLRNVIAHDIGDAAACARKDADECSDQTCPDDSDRLPDHCHNPLEKRVGDVLVPCFLGAQRVLNIAEQLRKGEEPDQHGKEVEPALKLDEAKGESLSSCEQIDSNHRERDSEHTSDQSLDQRSTAYASDSCQTEKHQ